MFALNYNRFIDIVRRDLSQGKNTPLIIPFQEIEADAIKFFINDALYSIFEQCELRLRHFAFKDRVLHTLSIVLTCLCDQTKTFVSTS